MSANRDRPVWQELAGTWTLVPRNPLGLVHFLGGAFVAAAPHLTYRWLLEKLADRGYAIVATPFANTTLDHQATAVSVLNRFEQTRDRLYASDRLRKRYLPVYGLGHSMGCKLHLLAGSLLEVERAGNILLSFNNYPVSRAIPMMDRLSPFLAAASRTAFGPGAVDVDRGLEFSPSPAETEAIVAESYGVRRNLLVKFQQDDIDQSRDLSRILQARFPGMLALRELPGNHLTPLGQDLPWESGREFSPLDAMGQWVKQEVLYRDLNRLSAELLRWLDPSAAPRP